jgi:hypothetical protein
MLAKLNGFIVSCSRSWWKVLLLFVGQSAAMQGLNAITTGFPAITAGDVPFDMQNSLTPAQIFEQLAGWSDAAFSSYYTFQAIDFLFPVLAGLFLASVCAFALRHAIPNWYDVAVAKNLFVLLLLATLFDYFENIFMLWTVSAWPEQVAFAAQLAVGAKMGKLTFMGIGFALTGIFLIVALFRWIGRKTGLIKTTA